MKKFTVVLCLMMLAAPAWADDWETPDLFDREYVAPSHDVPFYVPLTDAQQELPIAAADPGGDYVPGIEVPAGGTWRKVFTDQVPAVLPPIHPAQPAGLAPIPEVPQVTNPGVLPPIRPVTLGQ